MSVEGNEKADEAAKKAAEKPGIRQCPERFPSLAHEGRTITECKWKKARHWFRSRIDRQGPLERVEYDLALETQETDGGMMDIAA